MLQQTELFDNLNQEMHHQNHFEKPLKMAKETKTPKPQNPKTPKPRFRDK